MPKVRFADGRSFNFDVVDAHHIKTDYNFNHSKQTATAYFVVGIDDETIPATPIIIGDQYSIWLQHQEQVITSRRGPNKHTRLTAEEAVRARELFNKIVKIGEKAVAETQQSCNNSERYLDKIRTWAEKHLGEIIKALVIAVLTGLLARIGLKQ